MLIARQLYEQIVAHAQAEAPNECCGMVAARDGTAVKVYRATNAAALAALLHTLGAPLPAALTDVAAAEEALAAHKVSVRLANLRTQHDCLELLIDVESVAEGTYFVAISKLRGSSALRLSAEIMANEAQHWSALTELRLPGDLASAVPSPFVEGYP